jgi:structural maintenance of chromosome 2
VTAELEAERAQLSHFDAEIKALDAAVAEQKAAAGDKDVDVARLEHDGAQLAKDAKAAQNTLGELERLHPWIADEKANFGVAGTEFAFGDKFNAAAVRKEVAELEAEQKKNAKRVNPKAMGMVEGQEKQESTLKKNLAQVLKDKQKIEDTIAQLEEFKRDALTKTWEQVNKCVHRVRVRRAPADRHARRLFGDIFADLLPGNFAKLQPPDGQDIVDGLEVKVRLGTVWKQSLTELSGGQRYAHLSALPVVPHADGPAGRSSRSR